MRLMNLLMTGLALLFLSPLSHAGVIDNALAAIAKAPAPAPDDFDFIVFADTRSGEPVTLPEEFKQMIREFNILRPAFAIDIGDLILGGAAEGLAPQWDEFERVIGQCKIPFLPVTGNHDISDEPTEKIWLQRMGPVRYSFTYGNSKFIMLNSEEVGAVERISDEQVAWIKQELQNTNVKNIFLFLHQPYFATLKEGTDADQEIESRWGNVAAVLRGHPVKVVFGAHEHIYRNCGARDGVRYCITGGGGAGTRVPPEEGGFFHYLLVRVRGDQVSWSVIKPGNVLPEDVITADRVREIANVKFKWVGCEPLEAPYGQNFDRDVTFTIANPHDKPFASVLEWNVPDGWTVSPAKREYEVPPQGKTDLAFHIKADGPARVRFPVPEYRTQYVGAQYGPPIEVKREIPLVPVTQAVHAPGPIKVDADLAEWTTAASLPLIYPVKFDINAVQDLQSQVRLMWDEQNFYVAVETTDNEHVQPYAGDIVWSADNIELFLGDWHWGLTLTKNGPEVFLYEGIGMSAETVNKDVQLAVKREGTKTIYEAAFPARVVTPIELKNGASCRFSMIMNDLDSHGPRHWAELTPGAGSGENDFPRVKVILSP